MIHQELRGQIKEALFAKETLRLSVLRGILTALVNELVAKGLKPQDELPDADALVVIKRLAKQRKDSIEQFEKGGRSDLAASEKEELAILETYLPTMMPKDEIRKIAERKKAELGITDKTKMGMLMGAIIKEVAGKADGGDVKEVVDSLFA
ncbi:MAG: GatB/YqeY domain-containing protein [Minisyncoccota bacterium]